MHEIPNENGDQQDAQQGDKASQINPEFGCVILMGPAGSGIHIDILNEQNGMQRAATHADLVALVANALIHLQAQITAGQVRTVLPNVLPATGGFRFPGRSRR